MSTSQDVPESETAGTVTTESPTSPSSPSIGQEERSSQSIGQRARSSVRGSDRGQMAISPAAIITLVIALGVGVLVAAVLLVPSLDTYAGANTSNLTDQQNTMVDLVPTFAGLALALAFIGGALLFIR